MNLTHCQGELQYMFKNTSAGINPPYIFMGDLVKKNKTSIRYSPMNIIKKKLAGHVFPSLHGPLEGLYKSISFCMPGPYGNQVKITISLGPGSEFSSQ